MKKLDKITIQNALKGYLQDKEEIEAVYLYGSVVTGKDRVGSDVDIAILTTPLKDRNKSYEARIRYQTEISRLLGQDVDLVLLREAGELLCFEIFQNGEVIYEGARDTHRLFRAIRIIQCLDFQFLATRMQKGMVAAMKRGKRGS